MGKTTTTIKSYSKRSTELVRRRRRSIFLRGMMNNVRKISRSFTSADLHRRSARKCKPVQAAIGVRRQVDTRVQLQREPRRRNAAHVSCLNAR